MEGIDMAAIIDNVSIERLTAHNQAIARWVRLSGTPEEAKAFDYIAEALESYGIIIPRSSAIHALRDSRCVHRSP